VKQLVQDLRTGETRLVEAPTPAVRPHHLLVRATRSLVSPGTERMLVEFARAGWIEKARQQPEKVQQFLDRIRTDGLFPAIEAVFRKLNQPLPLGYCHVGRVIATGPGVTGFRLGDRVVSNGPHAEVVCVPATLAAPIPEGVNDEHAAFAVLGAVALQGIRLLRPEFGETVVVYGLGLIGMLAGQLLRASGCRVLGLDLDPGRLELASHWGIEPMPATDNPVPAVLAATGGLGCDGVLITAATREDTLIHYAARMSRKRGRLVLVGVTGLHLRRTDFYEKELSFQVSCSYGPGRYDEAYERKGRDYPPAYVRWTARRNFEAVLHALRTRQLDVEPLISERAPLEEFQAIYGNLRKPGVLASLLLYPDTEGPVASVVRIRSPSARPGRGVVGLIGAGAFASGVLAPALRAAGLRLKTIVSEGGLSAAVQARRLGFEEAASDPAVVWADPEVDLVVIATRHDSHARLVCEALAAGKHVMVEKPLALSREELAQVREALQAATERGVGLVVGFNRRFAPLALRARSLVEGLGPLNISATMNAGALPAGHWTRDPESGGGRVVGEACHLADLAVYLSAAPITAVCMNTLGDEAEDGGDDNALILLRMANGSQAALHYFSNGASAYPKERVEIFGGGRTLVLDNWRRIEGYGFARFRSMSLRQDKGHKEECRRVAAWVKEGRPPPGSIAEALNVTEAMLAARESLAAGRWIALPHPTER
jgi:predicted dehydrogenase/threonine dehydrogenase-like Zn-dependent dehydrogenase